MSKNYEINMRRYVLLMKHIGYQKQVLNSGTECKWQPITFRNTEQDHMERKLMEFPVDLYS